MGLSVVTAPAGTKPWELPLCTKTRPGRSLAKPRPLPTPFGEPGAWPRSPARVPGAVRPRGHPAQGAAAADTAAPLGKLKRIR